MESREVVVLVSHRALPGQEGRAKQELAELVATVLRTEPECHGIETLQHAADPTRITLIERWPSAESFLGPHMQTEHLQAFIARADEFLASPPDVSFWQTDGGVVT